MALKIVTPPEPVVTFEEADDHLRLSGDTSQQPYVESLIEAATGLAERWLGRAIGEQTWDLVYDAFPTNDIEIPLGPLISVTGVFYVDQTTGIETTLATDQFAVDLISTTGWVIPASSWPTTMTTTNAVRVRFVTGFDPVPAPIKVAILLIVGFLYAQRGESNEEMPQAAKMLMQPFRMMYI